MNSRKKIETRNKKYLKYYFNMSPKEWLNRLKIAGPPQNEFAKSWSLINPTGGWCGSVTKALMLSGKVPDGFIPCRNKLDAHFYMINKETQEVIDLTVYQMPGEYKFDYTDYKTNHLFFPLVNKSTRILMRTLKLKIDKSRFETHEKRGIEYYKKKKSIGK